MNDIVMNSNYIQVLDSFEKLEQNVAHLLILNHDLCRLLRYTDRDPLVQPMDDEIAEDILTEFDTRFQINPNCRIFFEPFTSITEMEQGAQLRIYPVQINPSSVYTGEVYVQVDVIVHQAISKIKGGRRRNRIMSEVLKSLNGQKIDLVNELRIVDKPISLRQFKDDYWGYSILLKTGVA